MARWTYDSDTTDVAHGGKTVYTVKLIKGDQEQAEAKSIADWLVINQPSVDGLTYHTEMGCDCKARFDELRRKLRRLPIWHVDSDGDICYGGVYTINMHAGDAINEKVGRWLLRNQTAIPSGHARRISSKPVANALADVVQFIRDNHQQDYAAISGVKRWTFEERDLRHDNRLIFNIPNGSRHVYSEWYATAERVVQEQPDIDGDDRRRLLAADSGEAMRWLRDHLGITSTPMWTISGDTLRYQNNLVYRISLSDEAERVAKLAVERQPVLSDDQVRNIVRNLAQSECVRNLAPLVQQWTQSESGLLFYKDKLMFYFNDCRDDWGELGRRAIRDQPVVPSDLEDGFCHDSRSNNRDNLQAVFARIDGHVMPSSTSKRWTFEDNSLRYNGKLLYSVGGRTEKNYKLGQWAVENQPTLTPEQARTIHIGSGDECAQKLQQIKDALTSPTAEKRLWKIASGGLWYNDNVVCGTAGDNLELSERAVREQPVLTGELARTIHKGSSEACYQKLVKVFEEIDSAHPAVWRKVNDRLELNGMHLYHISTRDAKFEAQATRVIREQPKFTKDLIDRLSRYMAGDSAYDAIEAAYKAQGAAPTKEGPWSIIGGGMLSYKGKHIYGLAPDHGGVQEGRTVKATAEKLVALQPTPTADEDRKLMGAWGGLRSWTDRFDFVAGILARAEGKPTAPKSTWTISGRALSFNGEWLYIVNDHEYDGKLKPQADRCIAEQPQLDAETTQKLMGEGDYRRRVDIINAWFEANSPKPAPKQEWTMSGLVLSHNGVRVYAANDRDYYGKLPEQARRCIAEQPQLDQETISEFKSGEWEEKARIIEAWFAKQDASKAKSKLVITFDPTDVESAARVYKLLAELEAEKARSPRLKYGVTTE